MVPDHKSLVRKLLNDLSKFSNQLKYSHNINGRWENGYLPIDLVPDVKIPMKFARDIAMQSGTFEQLHNLNHCQETQMHCLLFGLILCAMDTGQVFMIMQK